MRMRATADSRCCTLVDERAGVYKKLVISADGTRLLGGILVGDAADYGTWLQLMLNGMPLPARPESLLLPAGEAGESAGMGVAALPASAQICSCNNVTQGRDLRRRGCRRGDAGRHEEGQQGRQFLRRLRPAGAADHQGRAARAVAWRSTTISASTFPIRARNCSTW